MRLLLVFLLALGAWAQNPTWLTADRFSEIPSRGLAAWWSASSIKGISDAAAITTWTDLSNNKWGATQATTAKKPTYSASGVNGRPGVLFTAANAQILSVTDTTSSPFDATTAMTIITVIKPLTAPDATYRTHIGKASAWSVGNDNASPVQPQFVAQGVAAYNLSAKQWWNGSSAPTQGTVQLVEWDFNGTSAKMYSNGELKETVTASATLGVNNNAVTIGGISSSQYFDGTIAEILVYNVVLTSAERQSIHRRFCRYYKIGCSLPGMGVDAASAAQQSAATALTGGSSPDTSDFVHVNVICPGGSACTTNFGPDNKKYYLVTSTFPNSTVSTERTHLRVSDDGTTWTTLTGAPNPIHTPTHSGCTGETDADPDLTNVGGTLYLYELAACVGMAAGSVTEYIDYLTSTDGGVTWSGVNNVLTFTNSTKSQFTQPSLIYNTVLARWGLWGSNRDTGKLVRYLGTSAAGPWTSPESVTVTATAGLTLNHCNLKYIDSSYIGFCAIGTGSGPNAAQLSLLTSQDGNRWALARYPLFPSPFTNSWCSWGYEASIRQISAAAHTWDVHYSCGDGADNWRLGRTTLTWP